jgi:ABC-2 type transport system permease protein
MEILRKFRKERIEEITKWLPLLAELVKSEFKLRYQNSWLGYLWTLVKPLLLFGVIYLVFSVFMKSSIPDYPSYLLLGIILWTYFSEATVVGMNSLLAKRDLITKTFFPHETIVFSSTLSSTITFLLNMVVFFVFQLISGKFPGFEALFFVLYIVLLYFFVTGVTFVLATLFAFYHDLQHIWEVLLQVLFWLTPIIYQISMVPEGYHQLVFLNPMARFVEYSRAVLVGHDIPTLWLNTVLILMCAITFSVGYFLYKKQEKKIAEKI